jgi:hypothetical protein
LGQIKKMDDDIPIISSYVDPPLTIIREPRPPQRVLLPPKAPRVRSTSDIPVNPYSVKPPVPQKAENNYVSSVLKAGATRPMVREPASNTNILRPRVNLKPDNPNPIPAYTPPGIHWISNLVGKPFSEAYPVITMQRMPYRILQIDGIVLLDEQRLHRTEILLTIQTTEGLSPTGIDNLSRAKDRIRAQVWFSQNNDRAIINAAKLSQ